MKNKIESLQKSFEISSQQIEDAINPLEAAALFEDQKLSYVLIGGHMLSFYTGIARATVDVDFIIGNADFSQASKTINKFYQQFKETDHIYHVTYDTKKNVVDPERIDLIKDTFPLFREVVKQYSTTFREGKYTVKIPTIEAAVALKFAASISPNRGDENKSIDNADLLRLIKSIEKLDQKTLLALGELIYTGGGKELVSVVKDMKSGQSVSL